MNAAADSLYRRAQMLAATYAERRAPRILVLLEEAAAFEHAQALFELGNWRHFGIASARDDAAAARLWQRAAQCGHSEARFSLAIACERGIGLTRDLARAFGLYDASARDGDLNAIYEAGRCHYYGIGTALDRTSAAAFFERARRYGHLEALCDEAADDGPRRMPRPSAAGPFHPTRGA